MNNEALDSLRSQVNTTYCIVTRTYDSAGNMTGESRAEHPEPTIRLTHDQGVELLALINHLKSEAAPITHESAIDFLRNEGWLQKHDEELTKVAKSVPPKPIKKRLEPMFGVMGGNCPTCQNWVQSCHSFCGICGQAVTWDD